jgi:hypothetical protein
MLTSTQDREAEPRFGPPGGAARGGFAGGAMGAGPYGGGGGFNPAMAAGGGGGGGRQIYISNVCHSLLAHPLSRDRPVVLTKPQQLPFNVGWQDLKDLFRQAGKQSRLNAPCRGT